MSSRVGSARAAKRAARSFMACAYKRLSAYKQQSAFLIARPTTTLRATGALAGLVNRCVFVLYVSFAFFGALLAGLAFAAAHVL